MLAAPLGLRLLLVCLLYAADFSSLFFLHLMVFVELFLEGCFFHYEGAFGNGAYGRAALKAGPYYGAVPASEALGNIAPAYYLALSWCVVDQKSLLMKIE